MEHNRSFKRLIKNFLMIFSGSFVSKILSFFMVPFYTSLLSPEDYGTVDIIISTVLVIFPFFSLLMHEAVMRYVLDRENDQKKVLTIGFIVSSIGFVVMLCFSPVILFFESVRPYYFYIIIYYVVTWIYDMIVSYLKGLDKVAQVTTGGIIHTVLFLGLNIIFLAVFRLGIYGYLLTVNLANFITIIFLVFSCKIYREFTLIKKNNSVLIKKMIWYSVPMIPNYILWWVNNCSDRYILAFFCGTGVTGLYSVAYKIPTILNSVSTIFSNAWKISSVENFGSEESVVFYNKTYKMYSAVLFISGALLILITKPIASLLYAKDFFSAWEITPILILASVLLALVYFVESIFNASKKTKNLFYAALVSSVINIILNILLIPSFGATGAAIATGFSYLVALLVNMYNTRKLLKMNFNLLHITISLFFITTEIYCVISDSLPHFAIAFLCAMIIIFINRIGLTQIYLFINNIIKKILSNNEKERE